MRPGAGCFLFLAVGYAIVILMLPLPASGDIYSYAFYGRIMSVYDANPYVATPSMFSFDPMYQGVPTFWVSTRCVYGPGFSLMSAALAKGIREADSLIFAYRAIAVGATLATLCSPVLLPWYAVWTLPLGWLLPRVPRVAFIATSVAVSLTLVMDDPSRFPNVADLIVWIDASVVSRWPRSSS